MYLYGYYLFRFIVIRVKVLIYTTANVLTCNHLFAFACSLILTLICCIHRYSRPALFSPFVLLQTVCSCLEFAQTQFFKKKDDMRY